MTSTALRYRVYTFVPIPESLIFYALQFGGIMGLLLMAGFLKEIIFLGVRTKPRAQFGFFGLVFLAMLPANILSGASLISDLLYSQILLIVGFLAYHKSGLNQESLEKKLEVLRERI